MSAAAASGIRTICVPTPWAVGPVNVYLVEDDPLTLIDTGPIEASALAQLESALAARGHRTEDVGRVIVSHQHVDHWGLAQHLVERSGAELCALEGFDRWLEGYPDSLVAEDAFAADLLRRHGTLCDVLGYLDELLDAGAVVERQDDDGVMRFASV